MTGKRILLLSILSVLLFTACESGGIFRSKKRIKGKVEGTWQNINLADGSIKEVWEFTEDKVIRSQPIIDSNNVSTFEIINTGSYTVEAGFSKAFITLTNFDVIGSIDLTGQWEIYEISDEVLIIFTREIGGTVTREFVKQ